MSRPHIAAELRRQVIVDAGHRCGYCQSDEQLTGIPLSVEHIVPIAAGGTTTHENLWLSCRPCNELKGARLNSEDPESHENVSLFNPRTQQWRDHFVWSDDGTLMYRSYAHRSRNNYCITTKPSIAGECSPPLGFRWLASATRYDELTLRSVIQAGGLEGCKPSTHPPFSSRGGA